jgi:glycerophosphoryl diester phosphodiesterase
MTPILILGHRGAAGEAPENTLSGFRYARSLGLTGVELDVHLSHDGELVVIHDATVDRTTNASGSVADFTAAELAQLDARGTSPDWPDVVGVPTLREALDVLEGLSLIQIEIKSDTPERLERVVAGVLTEIETRGIARQTLITSFDTVAIEIVQRLSSDQARSFIGRHDDPHLFDTCQRLGCVQGNIHQFRQHRNRIVEELHAAGLTVGGGPCPTVEDLEAAIALGMDAVTSDFPSALLAHLARD